MIYKKFSIKQPKPAPHSRLYSLVPIDISTPYVESLTSYVNRLTEAHCLRLGSLTYQLIDPFISKNNTSLKRESYRTTFRDSRAINGLGNMATCWIDAVQSLTLQRNLACLTMVRWREIFADASLSRPVRAWCPKCFDEWQNSKQLVFEPLLWSLQVVNVCIRHGQYLRERCPGCQQQLQVLDKRSRPGVCSRCDHWLGGIDPISRSEPQKKDLEFQKWVVEQLGCLLSVAQDLPSPPSREKSKELIRDCIQRVSNGNIQHFINKMPNVNETTIKQWLYGMNRPSLTALMDVCFRSDVPVRDIILGRQNYTSKSEIIDRGGSRFFSQSTLEVMRDKIATMMNEKPPPSVGTVAKRIGCSSPTIKKHFPKLYADLKKKTAFYREEKYNIVRIRKELENATVETPPPSFSEVAGRLSCSRAYLKEQFPEEHCVIIERFAIYKRKALSLEEIEKELQELLKQALPLAIGKCAERVGYSVTSLNRIFPKLYRKILARYNDHKRKTLLESEKKRNRAVKKSIRSLDSAGIKPTVYRIKQHFPHLSRIYSREIEAVIRESLN